MARQSAQPSLAGVTGRIWLTCEHCDIVHGFRIVLVLVFVHSFSGSLIMRSTLAFPFRSHAMIQVRSCFLPTGIFREQGSCTNALSSSLLTTSHSLFLHSTLSSRSLCIDRVIREMLVAITSALTFFDTCSQAHERRSPSVSQPSCEELSLPSKGPWAFDVA